MKRLLGLFVVAALGGAVSLGVYHVAGLAPQPVVMQTSAPAEGAVQTEFVNYNPPAGEPVDFTVAAEMSVNAVVHVKTAYEVSKGYRSYDPIREFFYGDGYREMPSRKGQASGSGVIISPDGLIVTNNHVIDKADEVEIVLNNKESYSAKVLGTDPTTDLALLKIDGYDLPHVPYGNSDRVQVGEWVLAVGNPFNLNSTVTAGIVSAKGRDINILRGSAGVAPIESFIQTDAAVNPGNSGGALVNTRGELVGINTAIQSNTGSYTGYSFAIPVNIVKKVVDDLAEFGVVQRALIGVSITDINSQLADQEDLSVLDGAYVAGLSEDGAARQAGVKEGDVITQVGTVKVKNTAELLEQVGRFRPGDNIRLTIMRGSKEIELPVTLRNRYGNTQVVNKRTGNMLASLGATLEPVSDEEKEKLGIKEGLKVSNISSGKLRNSGINEGFVITRVDRKSVATTDDIVEALDGKSGGVLIEGVYPNGKRAYYGFGM